MTAPQPIPGDDATPVEAVVWQCRLRALRGEVHDVAGALTGLNMMLDLWASSGDFPATLREDLDLMLASAQKADDAIQNLRRLYLPELKGAVGDLAAWWEHVAPALAQACAPDGRFTAEEPPGDYDLPTDGQKLRDACLVQLGWGLRAFGPEAAVSLSWGRQAHGLTWTWRWETAAADAAPPPEEADEAAWLQTALPALGGAIALDVADRHASWRF